MKILQKGIHASPPIGKQWDCPNCGAILEVERPSDVQWCPLKEGYQTDPEEVPAWEAECPECGHKVIIPHSHFRGG